MKEVYILRHAEKEGNDGVLTQDGQLTAQKLKALLPVFMQVIASDSSRAQLTATLLTGMQPQVEEQAGFTMATPEKSDAINKIAAERNITFFEAAKLYGDSEVLNAIGQKAVGLNQLVDRTLSELNEGEAALIVSHDLTIAPAMVLRGQPSQPVPYLSGYRIDDAGSVTKFIAPES